MTSRKLDENGYISIAANPISRVGVFEYLGSSLPGAEDPNKVYKVYRPEDALNNEETLESFKLVPIVDDHEWLGQEGTPAEQHGVHGSTGKMYFSRMAFFTPILRFSVRSLLSS